MTSLNPLMAEALSPFAPRSHVTTVLAPDGSMQEARLPPPEPATCDAEWPVANGSKNEVWRCVLPAGHDGQHKREDPGERRRVLEAMIHDLQAQRDDIDGDALGATWHRAAAKAIRTGRPEDDTVAHAAWLTSMADGHLRYGHPVAEFCRDEILAEMERLKAQQG